MGEHTSSTPHKQEMSAGIAAAGTSTVTIAAMKVEITTSVPAGITASPLHAAKIMICTAL